MNIRRNRPKKLSNITKNPLNSTTGYNESDVNAINSIIKKNKKHRACVESINNQPNNRLHSSLLPLSKRGSIRARSNASITIVCCNLNRIYLYSIYTICHYSTGMNTRSLNKQNSFSSHTLSSYSLASQHQKRTKVKRRFGVRSQEEYDLTDDSCRIESAKVTHRKFQRRYAITSYSKQWPIEEINILKKFAIEDEQARKETDYIQQPRITTCNGGETQTGQSKEFQKDKRLIVFQEDGSLDLKYEGSNHFASLLRIYYKIHAIDRDLYSLEDIETHKSIRNSIVYHEVKKQGSQFLKKSLYHPDRFIILDDMQALLKVKERLAVEDKRHSRRKRNCVQVL